MPAYEKRPSGWSRGGGIASWRTRLLLTTALILAPVADRALADENEGNGLPFAEAVVFFELNNTDGDLGIHALIDGEPWDFLEIESPDERRLLNVRLKSNLRRQGLTELFFESAEPTFDELAPEDFFARFPEGDYEVEGRTNSQPRMELESTAEVTHLMPAPPEITVNGTPLADGCDSLTPVVGDSVLTVSWNEITLSHPDLGRTNEPIVVDRYQVVIEAGEVKFTIDVPPDVTEVEVALPDTDVGSEFKIEVLVREESGNQTASESCFEVS